MSKQLPMSSLSTKPCLIIHGGAGNITRDNLSPKRYALFDAALRRIFRSTSAMLEKGATALDAATHAVTLFEDCELFNCGKGAVSKDFCGSFEVVAETWVAGIYARWDY